VLVLTAARRSLDFYFDFPHTVGVMAKGDNLGEFEQLILAALLMLGDNAYGMTIHAQVEKTGEGSENRFARVRIHYVGSTGAKRLCKSWFSDPTPEAVEGRNGTSRSPVSVN